MYNDHAAIIMQIESKKGCENAQEILAVPGGSFEFSLFLGLS
jgi:2-keto-3-deoxy-L-rhamnonate aldolase RhmA